VAALAREMGECASISALLAAVVTAGFGRTLALGMGTIGFAYHSTLLFQSIK